MTDSNHSAIQVVMDRSGSMIIIKSDVEGALASFIAEQREEPGTATIRLVQFDTVYECVYPSTPLADAPAFVLHPRGGTALNDAIGSAINEFGRELRDMPEDKRPATVLFVIITDGQENSSKEHTKNSIKKMVEHQKDKWNWNFVFLAANQDAVLTGADYGFTAGSSMTFNPSSAGVAATSRLLGTYASSTRSGVDYQFTKEDREEAAK